MAESVADFLKRTKPEGGDAPASPGAQAPAVDPVQAFLMQTKPLASGQPGMAGAGPPPAEATVPSTLFNDPLTAGGRIVDAAVRGWNETPSFWTPKGREFLEHPLAGANPLLQRTLEPTVAAVTRNVLGPAGDILAAHYGAGAAAFKGVQQGIQEVGTAAGDPQLGRDAAAYLEAMPFGPHFGMPRVPGLKAPKYQGARTVEGADSVAKNHYQVADTSRTTLSGDFVNSALDDVAPVSARQRAKETTEGRTVVTEQLERLQAFRNKPMTIQEWQGLNEGLNTAIGREIKFEGITPEGRQLQQIQRQLRERVENATDADIISGGREGLDALKRGNEAYSQARKMEVVERMQTYADGTANPTTSMQQQVRTFIRNEKKHRGWSEAELTALQEAADRGRIGDFVHTMGSRLAAPLSAAAAIPAFETLTGGAPGMLSAVGIPLVGGAAGYLGGSPFRGIGAAMAERRTRNVFDVLGQRVPPNPLNIPEAVPEPPPAPPPRPPLGPRYPGL